MRLRILIATAAIATTPLASIASAQDAQPVQAAPVVLTVGTQFDLFTSNPLRVCACGNEYEFMFLNYNMLLRFDSETLEAAPELATEIPTEENGGISSDGLTWTFDIRDDVTWHDGTPLTARDIAWSFNYYVDNQVGAFFGYLPDDPTFEAPDDTTLVWRMTAPTSAPIAPAWAPVLPAHIWSELGDLKEAKQFENVPAIGSGPFQLVEWEKDQFYRFEANEAYWDGAPRIDEVVFRVFDNEETKVLALKEGEIDFVDSVTPAVFRSLEGDPGITTHQAVASGFSSLSFNFGGQGPKDTHHPALEDLTVRRAIALAIDKQTLVDKIRLGKATVGTTVVPPLSPFHYEPTADEAIRFDLTEANRILNEAGYRDTDGDGVREMPRGGEPLVMELMVIGSVEGSVANGKLIRGWAREIGIEFQLRPISEDKYYDVWRTGDFDAYIWGWTPDPDPNFILSIFSTNQCLAYSDGCYSDPTYDQLYVDQQRAPDLESRLAVVHEAQRHVYTQVPEIVLYYSDYLQAYRTDTFTGYTTQPRPGGTLLFQYGADSYLTVHPVTGGAVSPRGTGAISTGVWAAIVGGLALVVLGLALVRRARIRRDA